MINAPRNLEQAMTLRYGSWGGNTNGHKYAKEYCAYEVMDKSSMLFHQCKRKKGKGVAGLYCGTHAKMVRPLEDELP
jgi:hypothetical protein